MISKYKKQSNHVVIKSYALKGLFLVLLQAFSYLLSLIDSFLLSVEHLSWLLALFLLGRSELSWSNGPKPELIMIIWGKSCIVVPYVN